MGSSFSFLRLATGPSSWPVVASARSPAGPRAAAGAGGGSAPERREGQGIAAALTVASPFAQLEPGSCPDTAAPGRPPRAGCGRERCCAGPGGKPFASVFKDHEEQENKYQENNGCGQRVVLVFCLWRTMGAERSYTGTYRKAESLFFNHGTHVCVFL